MAGRTDGGGAPGLRLAPHAVLLRRSATELQIGVEPSVVVPTAYDRLVRALAAGAEPERLQRAADDQGLPPRALPDLLGALADARLLRPTSPVVAAPVRVVGAGRLGARVARELVGAGFRTLYLADLPARQDEPGRERRPGPGRRRAPEPAQPDRLDLLATSLQDTDPDLRVRRSRHFVHPEGDTVALTVVVADGPEPDRLVPDLLRAAGAPHLLVRCSGDEAVVGPLVVPGTTCCVRCTDLARRDADPRWPWLLEQLVRLPVDPVPTLLGWAAITATVQTLAFVTRGTAETLGQTLELRTDEHALRLRAWPVHPECPCGWVGATAPVVAPDLA